VGATSTASISAVADGDGRTSGTFGQLSSDDHMGEAVDRLTLSATSVSTLSPVPSSACAALVDPNWHRTMEEEFAALIANNI
jgi:hypothetical protein